MKKSYQPGCLELCAGGVFEPAEKKFDNALREVEEELGLTLEYNYNGKTFLNSMTDGGYYKYHYSPLTKIWCSLWVMRLKEE